MTKRAHLEEVIAFAQIGRIDRHAIRAVAVVVESARALAGVGADEFLEAVLNAVGRAMIDLAAAVQIKPAIELDQRVVAVGIAIADTAEQIHRIGVERHAEGVGRDDIDAAQPAIAVIAIDGRFTGELAGGVA